jgi:hypothetical protein
MTWCNHSVTTPTLPGIPDTIPHKGSCIDHSLFYSHGQHSLTSCHMHPLIAREANQFGAVPWGDCCTHPRPQLRHFRFSLISCFHSSSSSS